MTTWSCLIPVVVTSCSSQTPISHINIKAKPEEGCSTLINSSLSGVVLMGQSWFEVEDICLHWNMFMINFVAVSLKKKTWLIFFQIVCFLKVLIMIYIYFTKPTKYKSHCCCTHFVKSISLQEDRAFIKGFKRKRKKIPPIFFFGMNSSWQELFLNIYCTIVFECTSKINFPLVYINFMRNPEYFVLMFCMNL